MSQNNLYELYVRRAIHEISKIQLNKNKAKYKDTLADFIINLVARNTQRIIKTNAKYMEILKKNIESTGKIVREIKFKSVTRVLIETSSPFAWLIDEIGLAWDPILETPYIPSTQLKGAVRAAIEINRDEKLKKALWYTIYKKDKEKEERERIALFSFTNAYPVGIDSENKNGSKGILEREVITPIYGEEPEEDKAEPTPVQFIVIPRGVIFKCLIIFDINRLRENLHYIANKLGMQSETIENIINFLLNKLIKYTKIALEDIGLGAKTSSNYGYFELLPNGGGESV